MVATLLTCLLLQPMYNTYNTYNSVACWVLCGVGSAELEQEQLQPAGCVSDQKNHITNPSRGACWPR